MEIEKPTKPSDLNSRRGWIKLMMEKRENSDEPAVDIWFMNEFEMEITFGCPTTVMMFAPDMLPLQMADQIFEHLINGKYHQYRDAKCEVVSAGFYASSGTPIFK